MAQDIHSDLDQKTREEIMLDFRNRKLNILVATDLLSRGIDVDNIELIINYDVPHEGEDYIHRIGRTARAESDGVAITLISQEEQYKFSRIEKMLEKEVTKVHRLLKSSGTSPTMIHPKTGAVQVASGVAETGEAEAARKGAEATKEVEKTVVNSTGTNLGTDRNPTCLR